MTYVLFFIFIFSVLWLITSHLDSRDSGQLSTIDKIEKKSSPFKPFIQLVFIALGFFFIIGVVAIVGVSLPNL